MVSAALPQTSGLLEQRVRALTTFLTQQGISAGDAHAAALSNVYRQLGNQAHLLACQRNDNRGQQTQRRTAQSQVKDSNDNSVGI